MNGMYIWTMAEDNYEDPVVKISTIGNLETCKRAFFANEFDTLVTELKSKPYNFFSAEYKDASDMDGKMSFIAKNLNSGFVQQLDGNAKYLFSVFRCHQPDQTASNYVFKSLWIVNVSSTDFPAVLGSTYESFNFTVVDASDESQFTTFVNDFKKKSSDDETLVGEKYFH